MSTETPKQPIPGVMIQEPNPQFSAAQRLSYIKTTKDNNVVLDLEAKKWKHIYEALYFKTMTEQLQLEIAANEAARQNAKLPTPPQQEAPVTSGPWDREPLKSNMVLDQKIEEGPTPSYDAEYTTSGSMEELVAPVSESKPIMEVHHTEIDAD